MANEESVKQSTDQSAANEIINEAQLFQRKPLSEKEEDFNDEDWELVDMKDFSEPPRLDGNGTSLHFDVTLGWGHWQHTLCSVDYKTIVYPLEEKKEEREK